jgi:hypothetical protein
VRRLRIALLAVAGTVLVANAVASAGTTAKPTFGWWGFATPSRNIVCNSGLPISGALGLSCVVFSASSATKGQKTWALRARGRPSVRFVLGNIGTDVRVLAYGRSWRRGELTCTSRSAGLTCCNPEGHGFVLSRESQRVF